MSDQRADWMEHRHLRPRGRGRKPWTGGKWIPHTERYKRADEYMEVLPQTVEQLGARRGRSGQEDGGVLLMQAKSHPINHKGKWFSCPGISGG